MKNFLKRILMYVIIMIGIFIGCSIEGMNIIKVICIIGVMIFLWKTFGLTNTFIEEFKK
jgi:hypothetical protein